MYRKLLHVLAAVGVVGSLGVGAGPVVQAQSTGDTFRYTGLTSNNMLVRFNNSGPSRTIRVTGIRNNGNLQGIDYRPADRLLYGLTDTDEIYTINPNTGAATFVSKLSTSFKGGFQSGVDFNPAADRLRVVGSNDQNFRINVDTGEVTVDTDINFPGNSKLDPDITASAYTNSFAGPPSLPAPAPPTRTTQLYDIGFGANLLVLQDPPNDGTLKRRGSLGVNFAPIGGFDIFTNSNGTNIGYALSGSTLYTINLDTGAATRVRSNIPNGGFLGLAIRPLPPSN